MNSKKLAEAVWEMESNLEIIIDLNVPEIESVRTELNTAKSLLCVLANIVAGMPVDQAFGRADDWNGWPDISTAIAAK